MRVAWMALVLLACSGGKDGGSSADTDAEADADTDADTDVTLPPVDCVAELADCTGVTGWNNHGTGKPALERTEEDAYDSCGLFARRDGYQEPGHVPYYAQIAVRDLLGHLLAMDYDDGIDGVVDDTTVYTYDAWGHVIRYESDYDNDGTIDATTEQTWVGDELVEVESWGNGFHWWQGQTWTDGHVDMVSFDYDFDLVLDAVQQWIYEDDEVVLRRTDTGVDGSYELHEHLTWVDGLNTELAYDFDGDGSIDFVSTFRYDADGRRTQQADDYQVDGVVDYTYDTVWSCP
jgi:hypothetical protein